MPDVAQHLAQAARNEGLSQQLEVQQPEWAMTVLFYASLHYVEAYFFDQATGSQPQHYSTHAQRTLGVTTRLPNNIAKCYKRLYTRSRQARYDCVVFTTADVQRWRRDALEPIKHYVQGILRQSRIPDS